jgi:hypothetical protein
MCFGSPAAPPKPKEPPKAVLQKPHAYKTKEQREAETAASEGSQHLAKQKNRKSFRIQLSNALGGKGKNGSGLSL